MPQGLFLDADSQALVAAFQVGESAVQLKQLNGFNNDASARYVQLHDSEDAPTAGAVPRYVMLVSAGGSYEWIPGQGGRRFYQGLWVMASTTPDTLTAAGSVIWVEAQAITL